MRVAPDGTVTVLSKHIEFGQGPYTGLTTLVAEELDADWCQMRAAAAPADDELYKNLAFGMQGTGGSIIDRQFLRADAQGGRDGAGDAGCRRRQGLGRRQPARSPSRKAGSAHAGSGKEAGFGEFAEKAATMDAPADVKLKDPKDFVLIGKDRHKLDTDAKTDGTAIFTLDVIADDMLIAIVAHPAHFGATVKGFDDGEARADQGCRRHQAGSAGRRGLCREHLRRAEGPGGAEDRLGSHQGRDPLERADLRRLSRG